MNNTPDNKDTITNSDVSFVNYHPEDDGPNYFLADDEEGGDKDDK